MQDKTISNDQSQQIERRKAAYIRSVVFYTLL